MHEFFSAGHTTSGKWVYASQILEPKGIYTTCPKCGSRTIRDDIYSLHLKVEGKGKYPDHLLCGEYPFFIVSEKVVDLWNEASVTGFIPHKIKLSNGAKEITTTNYYNIELTSEVHLDLEKMGIKILNNCAVCGKKDFNKGTWEFGKVQIQEESWNDYDLFYFNGFRRSVLCSTKVLQIVDKGRLSNFEFREGQDTFNLFAPKVDLKKLFRKC